MDTCHDPHFQSHTANTSSKSHTKKEGVCVCLPVITSLEQYSTM